MYKSDNNRNNNKRTRPLRQHELDFISRLDIHFVRRKVRPSPHLQSSTRPQSSSLLPYFININIIISVIISIIINIQYNIIPLNHDLTTTTRSPSAFSHHRILDILVDFFLIATPRHARNTPPIFCILPAYGSSASSELVTPISALLIGFSLHRISTPYVPSGAANPRILLNTRSFSQKVTTALLPARCYSSVLSARLRGPYGCPRVGSDESAFFAKAISNQSPQKLLQLGTWCELTQMN